MSLSAETNSNQTPVMTEESLTELAGLFKTFGDVTRLRIMEVLFRQKELCVNDLAQELSMTQSAISHQLRLLKQSRLVRSRRDGKMIYYSLDDEHVYSILGQGMDHVMEHNI